MSGRIPLVRVLAEGTVIVVSILLAFGIDAWWQERGESETAADYLTRLQVDLAQDTADLTYLLEGLRRKHEALTTLQDAPEGLDQAHLAEVVLQAEQYGWGQFTFSGTTFDDLRSTGNLRLVEDGELRARLVDYYETWRLEQGRIRERRSELPALIYKLLSIRFAVDSLAASVGENRALDLRDLGGVNQGELAGAIRDATFRREMVHELNYTGFVRTALARLRQRAVEVLTLVEAASRAGAL